MSGKTLVGGLIGGLFAVEWTKRLIGVRRRTGDLFAIPLCAGIAIGRIGCFLGGLEDGAYGVATVLPWGVDFGDGVARHPTQVYEILWMGLVAFWYLEVGSLVFGYMLLNYFLSGHMLPLDWLPSP